MDLLSVLRDRSTVGVTRCHCRSLTVAATSNDDERVLREMWPTAANSTELLDMMQNTRAIRRQWTDMDKPTITAILKRYPRLRNMHKVSCCCAMNLHSTWRILSDDYSTIWLKIITWLHLGSLVSGTDFSHRRTTREGGLIVHYFVFLE